MSRKVRRRLAGIGALAALLLFLFIACDSRLTVTTYTVQSPKLSSSIRLVQISDLHSCVYGEEQSELLDTIAAAAPDAVMLTGDIVDDKLPEAPAWTLLEALASAYPCYYVTGNHEWWSGEAERICAQMEALGISVLRGEYAEAVIGSDTLLLCGIDDPDANGPEQLPLLADKLSDAQFSVLLAHRPEAIDTYLSYSYDLILSGHAHGGQWRIPGLINGLYAPNQGLFPTYAGGLYSFENAFFVVSRGLARESTLLPRIFNSPELVLIDITPA